MRTDAIHRAAMRRALSRRTFLSAAGAGGLAAALSACGSDGEGGGEGGSGSASIDWWHVQNLDPLMSMWQARADGFQSENSGVTMNVSPIENQDFKARLTTAMQAGDPPDIFQSWGGGVLAQQIEAGLVRDISADIEPLLDQFAPNTLRAYTIDDKVYGLPFSLGIVGFWYNIPMFEEAGITAPPETWEDFLGAVESLKGSGVTPIALAGADQWPGHYYWAYLAMRVAGVNAFQDAAANQSVDTPEFVEAGRLLQQLVALQPFQNGFLNATFQEGDNAQAVLMGNRQAAISLMGHFGPATQANATGTDGLGDDLGFFSFPAVQGGDGALTEVMGGGDGFVLGSNAPDEAIAFLEYFFTEENYREAAATTDILATMPAVEDEESDGPLVPVLEALDAATGFQLYLDQDFPPAVGQQINASVAALIAGSSSPEQVVQEVTDVWQREG